jgi:ribosomal protein L11 methylase PrmA
VPKTGIVSEVTIKTDSANTENIEILKQLLLNIGTPEEEIIECSQWPFTNLSVYFKSKADALALKRRLRAFHLKDVSIVFKSLEKRDWQTKWKSEFKPFSLTKTFGIIPSAYRNKVVYP